MEFYYVFLYINQLAMKTKPLIAFISILFVLSFSSCQEEDSPKVITKEKITGYVQKGPFVNGTYVSLSELRTDLSQTGKSFNSQIKDNLGTFELNNLQLSSPYAGLIANGFYFNEVKGETSTSQITLSGLADVTNATTLNVNVFSTIEKARVENLVAGGLSFSDAKKKALEEILAIFNMSESDIQNSELLDINKSGEGNAILLAVSSILQGFRSDAELSELLANLSADISTDGKLDSDVLKTALISHAKFLNSLKIRENLVKRYTDYAGTSQIPDFEKYIVRFINNSSFKAVDLFTYPKTTDGFLNLLNEDNLVFPSGLGGPPPSVIPFSCLSVNSIKGLSFKIKLEYVEGGLLVSSDYWGYSVDSNLVNWKISKYDRGTHSQFFEVIETGKPVFLKILFFEGKNLKICVSYYENNDLVPTRTRIVTVN